MTQTEEQLEGLPERVNGKAPTPPYMSFKGFHKLIDRLAEHGVPDQFDSSYFVGQSGSLTAQTRVALRFFDFMDERKRPTPQLRDFVQLSEDDRRVRLGELAKEKYADAFALGPGATYAQLQDVFRARGLTGDTLHKAINFFMQLAADVGLELSPHFKTGRAAGAPTGRGLRMATRRRTRAVDPQAERPDVVVGRAEGEAHTLEMKRAAYIDMLMKLAERMADSGEVPDDLLDRIERALGYEFPSQEQKAGDTPAF